jgi:predicted Rossmann-fold nucleotide-binding protein
MQYKIAVFGSASGDMDGAMPLANALGEALGEHASDVIVITGACPGLPYAAAKAAADHGVEVWGFSDTFDSESHALAHPDQEMSIYKKLVYVPKDFPFADSDRARKKYRNVISSATCNAAIIISGLWGTLNEFTNAIDLQKVVGVLSGTGGIADELPALSQKITKPGQGRMVFETDPKLLVEKILQTLATK